MLTLFADEFATTPMKPKEIIKKLEANREVFAALLSNKTKEEILSKPEKNKWCLLEIVCHLIDEEREDFRTRVQTTLGHPGEFPPPIDPAGWVKNRHYIQRNYDEMVASFLKERTQSIVWLNNLTNPDWAGSYVHESLGELSAEHFLLNWLAHDYLHIRQITRLQHERLRASSANDLTYAGNW